MTVVSIKHLQKCPRDAYFSSLKLDSEKGASLYYENVVRELLKAHGNFDVLLNVEDVRNKIEEVVPQGTFLTQHERDVNLGHTAERIARMAKVFTTLEYLYVGDGEYSVTTVSDKLVSDNYSFKVMKDGITYAVKMISGKTGLSMSARAQSYVGNSVELYFRQKVTGLVPMVFGLQGKESSYERVEEWCGTKLSPSMMVWHDFSTEDASQQEALEGELNNLVNQSLSASVEGIDNFDCERCFFKNICKVGLEEYIQGIEELETVTVEREPVVFTDDQVALINTRDGETRVFATAGSGKTTTIAEMVVQLALSGTPLDEITLCTFMNKGVMEIKEKIKERLAVNNSTLNVRDFHVVSLNGLGYEIIKAANAKIGLEAPQIISETEYLELIAKVADDYPMLEGLNYGNMMFRQFNAYGAAQMMKKFFDLIKEKGSSRLVSGAQVFNRLNNEYAKYVGTIEQPRNAWCENLANIYNAVQEEMKRKNLITFNDQIQRALYILRHDPVVKEMYVKKCRYLVIDEFQDTSSIQMDVIKELYVPDEQKALVVVGDANQSIMSFRHVGNENIVTFNGTFPHARQIDMSRNFRSTKQITKVANNIVHALSYNATIVAERDGDAVTTVPCADKDLANKYAFEKVKILLAGGAKLEDIAVIAKSRSELLAVRKMLSSEGIPNMLAVSDFLKDDNQIIALASLANYLKDRTNVLDFATWCRRTDMQDFDSAPDINEYLGEKIIETNAKFENLDDTEMYNKVIEYVKEVFPVLSNAMKFFLQQEEERALSHSFNRLASKLKSILANNATDGTDKVGAVYKAVTLSTIHAAKGREWKHVIVLTNGLKTPTKSALMSAISGNLVQLDDVYTCTKEVEEETRCLFVACTRAKDTLIVIGNMYWDACVQGLHTLPPQILVADGLL